MANFDGTDAFFDSRDVIERIAELTAEWEETTGDNFEDYTLSEEDLQAGLSDYDAHELAALLILQDEAVGQIEDWQYGETFHTHDSLVEYTQEIVNESYTNNDLPSWVTDHIDWEAVTDEVKADYTEFEFRGTTYYAR